MPKCVPALRGEFISMRMLPSAAVFGGVFNRLGNVRVRGGDAERGGVSAVALALEVMMRAIARLGENGGAADSKSASNNRAARGKMQAPRREERAPPMPEKP